MSTYCKQHYLPIVYLKQFSVDGRQATRKSLIWRCDEHKSVLTQVKSQCAEDHFYSKLDPQGAEETFYKIETAYGKIAQKISFGTKPERKDCYGLILMMLDLHCRNRVYENLTAEENIHAYKVRMQCMRDLMGDTNEPLSDQQFFDRWRFRLFENEDPTGLVTSDNPALFFTLDDTMQLHLAVMPVTPKYCAVAFDKRFIEANGNSFTDQDGCLLNSWQMKHCFECLFSPAELTAAQKEFVRHESQRRPTDYGYVDEQVWTPNVIGFPNGRPLSFLSTVSECKPR